MDVNAAGFLDGLIKVNANLSREIAAMKGRSSTGMASALSFVRHAAVEKTPKDTGNLRGSVHTKVMKQPTGVTGAIWYTAAYAAIVHEINKHHETGTAYQYTTPGTGWKFLEHAISENHAVILDLLRKHSKIQRTI